MTFNSIEFLIFFPCIVLIYYMLPLKYRYIWLLISSYYFYYVSCPKYVFLLLGTTLITYGCGRVLEVLDRKKRDNVKKVILGSCITLNLIPLFFYKYLDFFLMNINRFVNVENSPLWGMELILPIGISFYTFQALGYVIDVYRNEIKAEKNILKYGLFVSFFPLILSGPIERAKSMLSQIDKQVRFDVKNARVGLLSIAWGMFLKMVVADRIAIYINPIFAASAQTHGMILLAAAILFGFQIYCDFAGYSQMALGIAQILGYQVKVNFVAPYMAVGMRDFWRRWHISLTSWFRDYIYIPLGGNRKGKIRKYINNMLVFLISGLWHGAGWKFIAWGGLNGIFIVFEDMTKDIRKKLYTRLRIKTNSLAFRIISGVTTLMLINFCWIFFNASSLSDGLSIVQKIVCDFKVEYVFSTVFWESFITIENLAIIMNSLLIVFMVDWATNKGIDVKEKILNQQIIVRWSIYLVLIMLIMYWGAYGEGYEQTQFIYFQF